MSLKADVYAKRAFDFVDRIAGCGTPEAVSKTLIDELAAFGFEYVTVWSLPGPGQAPIEGVLLNTRPQDYVEHYNQKNLHSHDPVVTELRHTLRPFSWQDVRLRRRLSPKEQQIMDEAQDFDVSDGFIVPIFSYSGSLALVSPCGRAPDLSAPSRSAIEIISIAGQQALQRGKLGEQRLAPNRQPLTSREREVLSWVAAGKDDDEIGQILSISPATVAYHVENAKKKLDAYKRSMAIVVALRRGEISL
jgi:LuxR family transcriptional regulator, quorum-sensing system regulator BjaR1